MSMHRVLIIILLISSVVYKARAQYFMLDTLSKGALIHVNFSYHVPYGDLADRFGNNLGVGGGVYAKVGNNIIFGADGSFFFGTDVKEDTILDQLTTTSGQLIGSQGTLADIVLQERGFNISLKFGKIFPVIGPNRNSGILFILGPGIFQHKIKIEYLENDINNKVPQLEGEYRKGYDRLTNGVSITEFLGYINSSSGKLVNFYIGLEAIQAITQNRRSWNIDSNSADKANRLDLLFGIKGGWFFPTYKKKAQTEFFY